VQFDVGHGEGAARGSVVFALDEPGVTDLGEAVEAALGEGDVPLSALPDKVGLPTSGRWSAGGRLG